MMHRHNNGCGAFKEILVTIKLHCLFHKVEYGLSDSITHVNVSEKPPILLCNFSPALVRP